MPAAIKRRDLLAWVPVRQPGDRGGSADHGGRDVHPDGAPGGRRRDGEEPAQARGADRRPPPAAARRQAPGVPKVQPARPVHVRAPRPSGGARRAARRAGARAQGARRPVPLAVPGLGDLPAVATDAKFACVPGPRPPARQRRRPLGRRRVESAPPLRSNLAGAEYVVAAFMYLRLVGVPATKISIITTYNGWRDSSPTSSSSAAPPRPLRHAGEDRDDRQVRRAAERHHPPLARPRRRRPHPRRPTPRRLRLARRLGCASSAPGALRVGRRAPPHPLAARATRRSRSSPTSSTAPPRAPPTTLRPPAHVIPGLAEMGELVARMAGSSRSRRSSAPTSTAAANATGGDSRAPPADVPGLPDDLWRAGATWTCAAGRLSNLSDGHAGEPQHHALLELGARGAQFVEQPTSAPGRRALTRSRRCPPSRGRDRPPTRRAYRPRRTACSSSPERASPRAAP